MNTSIIDEFKKLVNYFKAEIDIIEDKKKKNAYNFKVKQLSRVVSILKNISYEITSSNFEELIDVPGIGKGSIKRIKEILTDGKLSELGDFVDDKLEKTNTLNELEEIVGVGRANALEFYKKGIKSVKMLKDKIQSGDIDVNDKIKLGLKYHNVYKKNIPRKEITNVYNLLEKVIDKINTKNDFSNKDKYIFEICGSYRREKDFSNDIDILISKKGTNTGADNNYLEQIVKKLKSDLSKNKKKPLLIDDMTDGDVKTKYMGFAKYKDHPIRRIDIRFVSYDSFFFALLYFTGSKDFNLKMRNIAKDKGYKLSEYGIYDENDEKIKMKVRSEKSIFKFLDMDYVEPKNRK
uniref:DNA-directed DNA polymerase n=1 Tax=Megaviridae environmental sample TaxID=1737588 RepID=A0A5J6VLX5_9VIRU|nr:MAG: DNA polymerase beta thumb [Megaviridae environmental sample]